MLLLSLQYFKLSSVLNISCPILNVEAKRATDIQHGHTVHGSQMIHPTLEHTPRSPANTSINPETDDTKHGMRLT